MKLPVIATAIALALSGGGARAEWTPVTETQTFGTGDRVENPYADRGSTSDYDRNLIEERDGGGYSTNTLTIRPDYKIEWDLNASAKVFGIDVTPGFVNDAVDELERTMNVTWNTPIVTSNTVTFEDENRGGFTHDPSNLSMPTPQIPPVPTPP